MRSALIFVLLAIFMPQATGATTIYLRDKTRIEKAQIVEELPTRFHVKREGEDYGLFDKYEKIDKHDIFCIIDDSGALRYPKSLTAVAEIIPGAADSLTAQELQMALLNQQSEQIGSLKGLGTVAFISALAAVSSSIALWCIYGLSK